MHPCVRTVALRQCAIRQDLVGDPARPRRACSLVITVTLAKRTRSRFCRCRGRCDSLVASSSAVRDLDDSNAETAEPSHEHNCTAATGVPRETISKKPRRRFPTSVQCVREGVYRARRPHRRVNTQRSNRFAASRPLNSMRLAVSEKASRTRLVGRAVTAPTPDQGDEDDGEADDGNAPCTLPAWPTAAGCGAPGSSVVCWPGVTAIVAGPADPRPAMARLASAGPPVRASSIIPSNRPRIETPRRAASASTQARRSWSRRMPTTVDFEVAMAPLTVIPGVYIGGAEWWQPGGGRRRRGSPRTASGTHRPTRPRRQTRRPRRATVPRATRKASGESAERRPGVAGGGIALPGSGRSEGWSTGFSSACLGRVLAAVPGNPQLVGDAFDGDGPSSSGC